MSENKKIVLFDGTTLDGWTDRKGGNIAWTLEDGIMTVGKGDIISKETYGDALLHVEFRIPDMPNARGQGKGNSGVYVHGCYEIQVLDSYGIEDPGDGDCSAIYNMYSPLLNACKPAMEWQTYDILIRAPRFDAKGQVVEDGRISVFQNGLPVHNNAVLPRHTPGGITDHVVAEGPLMLQDHGNPVSYRNIWVLKLPETKNGLIDKIKKIFKR